MPQHNEQVEHAIKLLEQALVCLVNAEGRIPQWDEINALVQLASNQIAVAQYLEVTARKTDVHTHQDRHAPDISKPALTSSHDVYESDEALIENDPTPSVITSVASSVKEASSFSPQHKPAIGLSLAEKLQEQKLFGLVASLSINDRVKFASALFEGNVPALLETCQSIETSGNFEEALKILQNKGDSSVDWEEEDSVAESFLAMVRRLFIEA